MFFFFGSSSEEHKVASEGHVVVLLRLQLFMFKLEEKQPALRDI